MIMSARSNRDYRWKKPTWERAADSSFVFVVPASLSGEGEELSVHATHRLYDVFEFDGTWIDQLHERQVEQLLVNRNWRQDYQLAQV